MPEGRGSGPEEEPMEAQPTSVLVVAGSLVGLSAAVFLAWRGGPTVLVERQLAAPASSRGRAVSPTCTTESGPEVIRWKCACAS